jgi:DNA-directed RNA polymerase specialized sigma24 family protein
MMTTDVDLRALGQALHDRLRRGEDQRVTAEIAEAFLPLLVHYLKRKYPSHPDPHDLETAAEDALDNYWKRPEQYDPARSSLLHYLCLSAEGDLWNLWRKRKSEQEKRKSVADDPSASEYRVTTCAS